MNASKNYGIVERMDLEDTRESIEREEADRWAVGVWPPVSTRQDMGRTIRGGTAHKIKACTALLGVHRKILYSTKYDIFLVTLPLQSI